MTTLLTGGNGKTASRLAGLLHKANVPILLTSRSGKVPAPCKGVRFDWYDPETYSLPFDAAGSEKPIDKVYLAGTNDLDLSPMIAFIDFAVARGVKRFVLLSASAVQCGDLSVGKVHEHIVKIGVEYTILRPTWFQENMTEQHYASIKEKNTIYSAAEDGLLAWISAEDIAAVAFRALVDEKSRNTDYILAGPRYLSYDDVAKLLTEVLGRKIVHTRISIETLIENFVKMGLSREYSPYMAGMDTIIAGGGEANLGEGDVERVLGRKPKSMRTFLEEVKDALEESEKE